MKKINEMRIDLEEKEYYFPGETLKGQVVLNISKPTTTEYITLTFRGWIEWQGEKVELIGESKKLALPISAGQKYTVFEPEKKNAFDFEFKIPENVNLPSSIKIPKVVDIRYTLTAADKKPLYKKLQTLPTTERTITLLDLIDVELPQFCNEVRLSGDLGFMNDIRLTQWNMRCPRSAFLPGEVIPVDVEIKNFPVMSKQRFLKVSLYQTIYRTHNPKVIGKYTIAESSLDVNLIDLTEFQLYHIPLKIPHTTSPTVFPLNGRIISISYSLCVEINMKDVKSAIFLKDSYTHESVILLGTYTSSSDSMTNSYYKRSTNEYPLAFATSTPLPLLDEKSHFPDEHSQSQPLIKNTQKKDTDDQFSFIYDASSMINARVLATNKHSSCVTMRLSKDFDGNISSAPKGASHYSMAPNTSQNLVPIVPNSLTGCSNKVPQSEYCDIQAPHQMEIKPINNDICGTIFMDSLVLITEKKSFNNQVPHEIGPQDTICKTTKKKAPGISRYDTESTCSTSGTPQPNNAGADHFKEIFV